MEIKEIKEKNIWEGFLENIEEKTFLQSWNWGEFGQRMGHKIWRLGIFSETELITTALVFKIQARRGTFLFVPHGPLVKSSDKKLETRKEILKFLLEHLKKLAREEGASFVRFAPVWERTEENIKAFQELNFREAPIHMHPETTWQLNIAAPEEEILGQMRKTTRYLIRQAEKNKEISVSQGKNLNDLEIFNKIYQETSKRQNFTPFNFNFLKNQLEVFSPDNQIAIFLGKHGKEFLATAIVVFWQGIAFYHHGASFPSKQPVSYAVQWEIIKEVKRRGCRLYNFWGISEEDDKNHPWTGLTLFKKGFGGEEKKYVKTQDYLLSPRYWLNFVVEKVRKIKRGF